jgi:hypothetical protein
MARAYSSDRNRPSDRELTHKVDEALEAILAGRRQIGLTKHLLSDCVALGLASEAELWQVLPELFREIKAADPISCYAGQHPPSRSYDDEMRDMELWPFHWLSQSQGKMMFIKFALKRNRAQEWVYVHVDVHEDRPNKH